MSSIIKGRVGADQVRSDFFFKPDVSSLKGAMDARQKKYDTNASALAQATLQLEQVQSLEGYDKNRWLDMNIDFLKGAENVKNAYKGDLSKADAELSTFLNNVGESFGIDGEARAIDNRYKSAMENFKELEKRRSENKITEGQFRMWHRELRDKAEIGIGKKKGHWNTWNKVTATDAVDAPKFLNDFMKNKESDLLDKGWVPSKENGKIVYRNASHDVITYESLMEEATAALRSEMDKTGELNADYLWDLEQKGQQPNLDAITTPIKMNSERLAKDIAELQTLTGEALQRKINEIYGVEKIHIDGKMGRTVTKHQQLLLKQLTDMKTQADTQLALYEGITDPQQIKAAHYSYWANKTVSKIVDPYAKAKSRDKIKSEIKITDDIYLDHQLKMQRDAHSARISHSFAIQQMEYQHRLNNPIEIGLSAKTGTTEVTLKGKTPEELQKEKDGIKQGQNTLVTGLLQDILLKDPKAKELLAKLDDPNNPYAKLYLQMQNQFGPMAPSKEQFIAQYSEAARIDLLKMLGTDEDALAGAQIRITPENKRILVDANGKTVAEIPSEISDGKIQDYLAGFAKLAEDRHYITLKEDEAKRATIAGGNFTKEEKELLLSNDFKGGKLSLSSESMNNILSVISDKNKLGLKKKDGTKITISYEELNVHAGGMGGVSYNTITKEKTFDMSNPNDLKEFFKIASKNSDQSLEQFTQGVLVGEDKKYMNLTRYADLKERYDKAYAAKLGETQSMTFETYAQYNNFDNTEGGFRAVKRVQELLKENLLQFSGYELNRSQPSDGKIQSVKSIIESAEAGKSTSNYRIGKVGLNKTTAGHIKAGSFAVEVSYDVEDGFGNKQTRSKTINIPLTEINDPYVNQIVNSPGYVIENQIGKARQFNITDDIPLLTGVTDYAAPSIIMDDNGQPQLNFSPITLRGNIGKADETMKMDQMDETLTGGRFIDAKGNSIKVSKQEILDRAFVTLDMQNIARNLQQHGIGPSLVPVRYAAGYDKNGRLVTKITNQYNYAAIAKIIDKATPHLDPETKGIFKPSSQDYEDALRNLQLYGVSEDIGRELLQIHAADINYVEKRGPNYSQKLSRYTLKTN